MRLRTSSPYCLAAIMFAVLVVTNRWYDSADETSYASTDGESYFAIARAAPALPQQHGMAFNHAQRFAAPYLLGLLIRATGWSQDAVFRLAALVSIAGAAGLFVATLLRAHVDRPVICAATALYLFNPYLVRLPLSFSGVIDQPLFLLGLGIVMMAGVEEHSGLLVAGAGIAALGRQTAMTFLPALLLLGAARRRWSAVIAALLLIVAIYFGTAAVAQSFARPSINGTTLTGVFHDLGNVRAVAFLSYLRECATPLAATSLLLLFIRDARSAAGELLHRKRNGFLAVLALGVVASPLLMGPLIGHGSGSRLAALALPPLAMLMAFLLDAAGRPFVRSFAFPCGVSIAAFLGSLHHIFTGYGIQRWQFGVLSVVSWLVIAALALTAAFH